MDEKFDGESRVKTLEQAILAMILLLVILPAWRMYILPKAAWTATCRLQVGG